MASISSREYTRLAIWSKVEPIGFDALIIQIARVAQAMQGGKLEDFLVFNTTFIQSPEEIAAAFGRMFGNGNNRKP